MDFVTFHNIVAGKRRGAENTRSGTNPLDKTRLWDVPVATAQDVEDSVIAAQQAFPAWARTPYEKRTELLETFADLYLAHATEFCQLLAAECGRTVSLGIMYDQCQTLSTRNPLSRSRMRQ